MLLQDFISQKFKVNLQLKWPNDLYINQRKCGGILLHHHDGKMNIGIGLNLLSHSQWSGILSSVELWKDSMSHEIPREFFDFYLLHSPVTQEKIKQSWLTHCAHLKKIVTLVEGREEYSGFFQGLGTHGEAIIDGKSYFNGSLRIKDL